MYSQGEQLTIFKIALSKLQQSTWLMCIELYALLNRGNSIERAYFVFTKKNQLTTLKKIKFAYIIINVFNFHTLPYSL